MNHKPLISVIIPVYNVEPYLRQCLDSVVSQTYDNLSIILVDDGSTDGSGRICDEYALNDPRITVFHTENRGLSAARNKGLDNLNNESAYVSFIDSDDWVEADFIQKMYEAAEQHNADIVSCCYMYEPEKRLSAKVDHEIVLENDEIIAAYIKNNYLRNVVWNKLYRSTHFSCLRYPEGMVFEDIAVTYKILGSSQKTVMIPDALIHYRVRHDSISKGYSIHNLIDYWKTQYEKYTALSDIKTDPECSMYLIKDCLNAIRRIWVRYDGYSREEQLDGKQTVNDMRAFAKQYRHMVLSNSFFSGLDKATCIAASSPNPVLFLGMNKIFKLYCYFCQKK